MINFVRTQENINLASKWEHIIFGNNAGYKKNYIEFLSSIKTFVTTSQVIGELQGLVNSKLDLQKASKSIFWKSSAGYLKFKNLEEELIKIITTTFNPMHERYVFDIGFIDTGLIELAKSSNLPIVTNDERTLGTRARESFGINIIIPMHHFIH